ncbi:glycerol-3-phosphate 1-O-acyltransferase PlsY [bacterium]|nr:glycerol-3-phosphate 1-O-acyltransferase PlsY [bacterium]
MSFLLIIFLSYLAGSIPTAIICSRLILKDDIRNHGSKNAGATNVFRVMGWKPALVVVLIDIAKGMVAVLLIVQLGDTMFNDITIKIFAGLAAIIGHVWTVFAGFKGGKGVGTAFGVLLGLAPIASLITFAVWLILVLITRIVSLGSIAAALIFPMALFVQRHFFSSDLEVELLYMGIGLAVLIFVTHRANVKRLLRGEENRFGSKKNN